MSQWSRRRAFFKHLVYQYDTTTSLGSRVFNAFMAQRVNREDFMSLRLKDENPRFGSHTKSGRLMRRILAELPDESLDQTQYESLKSLFLASAPASRARFLSWYDNRELKADLEEKQ
jgi:hypothetical protein